MNMLNYMIRAGEVKISNPRRYVDRRPPSHANYSIFKRGIEVDCIFNYADGESWVIEEPVQTEPAEPEEIVRENPAFEEVIGQDYVLNTNTKKFHYPSCSSVGQMKEKNKREYTGTRDEIISQGYDACKKCNP